MAQYDYDLFTIGAGSGGVRASRYAARIQLADLGREQAPREPVRRYHRYPPDHSRGVRDPARGGGVRISARFGDYSRVERDFQLKLGRFPLRAALMINGWEDPVRSGSCGT